MDELGGFEPTDTTGFIQIESIRIKKYGFVFIIASVSDVRHQGGHRRIPVKIRLELRPKMPTQARFECS